MAVVSTYASDSPAAAVAVRSRSRVPAGRRPRLLHVSTSDMSIGVLLLNQLVRYREAGYEVVAVCSPGPYLERVVRAGIRVVPVPMRRAITPGPDLVGLWALWRVFRRERPDVVHTHTPKAGLLGQWAARLARVPRRVHTIHGLYFPGDVTPRTRPLYVGLERATMAPAHLVLSQNPEDIPVAVAERICPAHRIRFLGNGIDVSRFDPASVSAARVEALRREAGVRPGERVVGIVGRVNREKGYEEFFAAAAAVARERADVRFVVVGPVEREKSNHLDPERLAAEHGLAGRVACLGLRDDVRELYRIMDLVVLPSHREGWPRVPMEAAAMGVPAVVTDIRGCRQVVVDGATGVLVPPRDVPALAAAILRLLDDAPLRRGLGAAAREHALTAFDERVIVERTLAAYAELGAAP